MRYPNGERYWVPDGLSAITHLITLSCFDCLPSYPFQLNFLLSAKHTTNQEV